MSKVVERNCNSCRLGILDDCTTLKHNEEYKNISCDGFFDTGKWKFKENFICDNYNCRYIEYPIDLSKINRDTSTSTFRDNKTGKLVKIRPCAEEHQSNTFLGLFLGDLPVDFHVSHNPDTKELNLKFNTNPAIYVFELKKIVYGYESWWGLIESEDELKEITDNDIDNIWYVKLLKNFENSD